MMVVVICLDCSVDLTFVHYDLLQTNRLSTSARQVVECQQNLIE